MDGIAIVYCQGAYLTANGKTAHGLVRFTQRYQVAAVIDATVSGDAGTVLDGKERGIPLVPDVATAIRTAKAKGLTPTHFVMGLAPDGGRLPPSAKDDVKRAIEAGLNVDSGLHDFLSEDPQIVALAEKHNVRIRDVRKPPARDELHSFTGAIEDVRSFRIAMLGTDSAVGKRTTSWMLVHEFERRKIDAEMIGTGQTAWMQGVKFGIVLDSIVNDFLAGELENTVVRAWKEERPEVMVIEGQGSLMNPAYPGGYEILAATRPHAVVVQHAPTRKDYDGFPGYPIHPLERQIQALEIVSDRKVAAITLNTERLTPAEVDAETAEIEKETGLVTVAPLFHGVGRVVDRLDEMRRAKMIEGLGHLLVIDRLDVGPVELEDDKLTMPYAVTRMEDGAEITDATELIYKFQEPVFTKREDGTWDPHDVNLASLIGAQVALNYGLFCKEIRFRGPFDKNDRGFLRDMAANTAREIYVKKILEPNPFLTLAKHPTVRTRTYVQAELTFEGEDEVPSTTPWVRPESERAIAVLSSGGKDSLLSTGLLEEIGQEVHPLFVNESGRHWFTAINGFRLMEDRHPDRTARVWTNSDRVFPWMLKHLPFVRPDHQRLRSDEYPIRLWTVAVFLFGVLPLMKKRGLDRLVIGDEFDTTVRARTEGIPHWNGLFDQSRIFDATLTRFFHKKGWKVHQFSILRPMSELLIQRALMKRYPDLFAAQMSCHATHTEGDRVRPCGRCEKCRRIVGMVLSEGGDPEACGYTPGQIEPALSDLAKQGAHQEKDGVRHLAWSLLRKGLISRESPLAKIAKQMPHVVRLRFDSQVSPVADVPPDLRAPLYRIMLEHADGAVRLEGRSWESFDLLAPHSLATPSAFARALQDQDDQIPPGRPTHRLAELTWPQARRRLSEVDVAILPVGAVEQHGKHLPLDVDIWDVVYQADEVAKRCSEPRPLVFPGIPYGVSYHHDDFAGTLSISPETLSKVIYEIGMSAARNGIRKLVILNGHGGNVPALQFAAQMINRDAHIFTCVDSGETSDSELQEVIETPNDVHAGELETSTTLAMRPELVYMDRAETHVPRFSSRYLDFGSNVSVSWFTRTSRISPSGVMGDPTKATPEKGRRAWEITIANMVELVEHLKTTSLEEIYRRRE